MDCQACQPLLLELAQGALESKLTAEVRAHVDGCLGCNGALLQLRQGIELAHRMAISEPSAEVHARIMELAHAHVANHSTSGRRSRGARRSLWQAWLDFVGRFAMTPQVGMATIMLLIAVGSAWVLPTLRREPRAVGGTVVNPDPEGEAIASSERTPAERLDLAVERGRIRSRDELSTERSAAAATPAASPAVQAVYAEATPAPSTEEADKNERAPSANSERDALGAFAALGAADGAQNADADAKAKQARSAPKLATDDSLDALAEREAPIQVAAGGRAAQPASVFEDVDARSAAAAARAASAEPAKGLSGSVSGLTRNRAPSPAAESRAASTSRLTATQLLAAARKERTRGNCGGAALRYEELLANYPTSSDAGPAMIEAATCYRSLGQTGRAITMLKQASSKPAVSARANDLLQEMAAAAKTDFAVPASAP